MSDDYARARNQALELLARREYSRAELARRLEARQDDRTLIEHLLDELAAEGLQSDARFAESYIRSRVARGYGPLRILHELKTRGIKVALTPFDVEGEEWLVRARRALEKRHGRPGKDPRDRSRQARFLEYRGYTQAQIRSVLGAVEE